MSDDKKNVYHISVPLKIIQDKIAEGFYGQTVDDAHENQTCIHCKLPVADRILSERAWREYELSGLCQICFDTLEGGE